MTTPKTNEEILGEIDPNNFKAGDKHLRLHNAVTKAQLAYSDSEMHDTRIEVFEAVKELLGQVLTQKDTEIQKAREEWLKIIKNTDRKFANNYEAEIMKAAYLLAKADIIKALAPPKKLCR